jgi:hypothetical protein
MQKFSYFFPAKQLQFGGLNRRKCDCIRRILKSDRATGNARPVISFARLQPLMRHRARSSPAHCPPLNLPSSSIRHPPSARGSDGTTAAKPHYHPAALKNIYSRSSLAAATLQATKILTQPSWRSGGAPTVTRHRLHYPDSITGPPLHLGHLDREKEEGYVGQATPGRAVVP